MLRLALIHAKDQPETPQGEDGPTAWLIDEKGNAVFQGHVVADAYAMNAPASSVSISLRFVGSGVG